MSIKRSLPALGLAGVSIAAFAAAPVLWPHDVHAVQAGAAAAALVVVALNALRADEVARKLTLQAGALAFLLSLIGAVCAAALNVSPSLVTEHGWAAMVSAWLVSWIILRVRLG